MTFGPNDFSVAALLVLRTLLDRPDEDQHGYVLAQHPRMKGVSPGQVYRHLRKFEEAGLVTSAWDLTPAGRPGAGGRGPVRRMYRLTLNGGRDARHLLSSLAASLQPPKEPDGRMRR